MQLNKVTSRLSDIISYELVSNQILHKIFTSLASTFILIDGLWDHKLSSCHLLAGSYPATESCSKFNDFIAIF